MPGPVSVTVSRHQEFDAVLGREAVGEFGLAFHGEEQFDVEWSLRVHPLECQPVLVRPRWWATSSVSAQGRAV
jgi:hypothetical protein